MCRTRMWGGVRKAHIRRVFLLLTRANCNLFFSSSLFVCLVFFFSPFLHLISYPLIPMHRGSLDEPSDMESLQSYGILDLGLEDENYSDYTADTRPSRSLLRSRHPIDLYASGPRDTSSHTSGSSLRPSPNFSTLPHLASSLGSPRPSIETIASLSISEIYHNPHYRDLRMKYDRLSDVFATYLGKDLAEFHVSRRNTHFPGALPGA